MSIFSKVGSHPSGIIVVIHSNDKKGETILYNTYSTWTAKILFFDTGSFRLRTRAERGAGSGQINGGRLILSLTIKKPGIYIIPIPFSATKKILSDFSLTFPGFKEKSAYIFRFSKPASFNNC